MSTLHDLCWILKKEEKSFATERATSYTENGENKPLLLLLLMVSLYVYNILQEIEDNREEK